MIYEVVYKMYNNLKEGNRIEIPEGCLVLWERSHINRDKTEPTVIKMLVPVKLTPQENGMEEIPNLIRSDP